MEDFANKIKKEELAKKHAHCLKTQLVQLHEKNRGETSLNFMMIIIIIFITRRICFDEANRFINNAII